MNASIADCPQESDLLDYLQGKLSPEITLKLESHFSGCNRCEETIRGLGTNDTFR